MMRCFPILLCFTLVCSLQAQQNDFEHIDFWRADYIARTLQGEALYNLPVLTHQLTATLPTEVERFRAIYYWVCHNIRGDFDLMHEYKKHFNRWKDDPEAFQKWNRQFKKEVFKTLLQEKETLCTGYAYILKELANLAGLDCNIIYGYGQVNKQNDNAFVYPNHSWNTVKLDGKWYVCDATWSAGFTDMANLSFNFEYDDSYFLMEPSEFAKSHIPVDTIETFK